MDSDLSAYLWGWLPVIIAEDLNAKHVGWYSGLITTGPGFWMTKPTKIPAWFTYWTSPPLSQTTLLSPPMSWTSYLQKTFYHSVSDHVLPTELTLLACTEWHKMSFILCHPTRPPRYQAGRHQACLKGGLPSNQEHLTRALRNWQAIFWRR
jgi:hypothetical protein